jgi:hypothetical protein
MVWIFARGNAVRKFETRYDNDAAFQSRLEALEQQLAADRWRAVGTPVLLPDGWKI